MDATFDAVSRQVGGFLDVVRSQANQIRFDAAVDQSNVASFIQRHCRCPLESRSAMPPCSLASPSSAPPKDRSFSHFLVVTPEGVAPQTTVIMWRSPGAW